jgi:two-component system sensor histidine kinase DegS
MVQWSIGPVRNPTTGDKVQTNPGREEHSYISPIGLSSRDILLMEEERHRLARELHDGLLQTLTAMAMSLEVCKRLSLNTDIDPLQDELAQLELDFQKSINDLRELMGEWRLPSLNEANLGEAIDHYVHEYETSTGIEVSFDLNGFPDNKLDREQKVAVFRILQEALRNTKRHSGASKVWIEAAMRAENLQISIKDNGRGFNLLSATANYPRQGLGLAGMHERAKALGGQLHIDSQSGRGTSITLTLPLEDSRV